MYAELAVIAAFAFLYSLVARRLERTPVAGPVVFITFGLIVGPVGFGWIEADVTSQEVRVLADLTLAIFLFVDAAHVNQTVLKQHFAIPARMLFIGLPGVMVLGFLTALFLFDALSVYEMVILAVMLAATDAALGKAVITNKAVPERLRVSLNFESGMNDGLCVPLLLLFITLAKAGGAETDSTLLAVRLVAQEVGLGVIVGLGVTASGTWLIRRCDNLGWMTGAWRQLPVIMLALSCFSVAQTLHGSGYVAAFVGGLLFSFYSKELTHELVLDAEGLGETLAMLTWIVFGVAVIGLAAAYFDWRIVLYAMLSLTVVRMLPVFLSLAGTGERTESRLFLAWFGPRGLASIVFAVIVLDNGLPGGELLATIVICTVYLSAIAHGFTANPFAKALAARLSRGD